MNSFWAAWLKYGGPNWKAISKDMVVRNASECQDAFKALSINALKDTPGWLRIDVSKYVAKTTRRARFLKRKTDDIILDSTLDQGASPHWRAAEHEILLKAVETYGLFSRWDTIRKLVRPELSDDKVEAEYYKLNGVTMKSEPKSSSSGHRIKTSDTVNDEWTEAQVKTLNTILMKYSSLPIWTEEAAKHGIEACSSDYMDFFKLMQDTSVKSPTGGSDSEDLSSPSAPKSMDNPGLNWTKERVSRLKRLVGQQQQQERFSGHPINWSWIAEHIGPGFDASACIMRWQVLPAKAKVNLAASRFWDEKDIELFKQGIIAHGKSWSTIQQNFLPTRSIDSIRRKLTNLQRKRRELIQETESDAKILQASDPDLDLDVDGYVHGFLKDHHVYKLTGELEALCDEHGWEMMRAVDADNPVPRRGRPKTKSDLESS
ncbi:hypothetical protein BGZ65_006220 [Modicella reniformis]|uniref:Myb-like domain-containing protein n=1 Tax=Modicella reniformis TaxID=1440133 RepID=A0A9P6M7X8_9FUNG|nr:hypothetical protein BGZ65_006220 [Modicella reniformis]